MKRFVLITMVAACALAVSPSIRAQDCGNWSNSHLRGTYTMSGSGWADPSKKAPGLPEVVVPTGWAGALVLDGKGAGRGWVAVNLGGVQLNAEFVKLTYEVMADCRVNVTYSMKVKELGGATLGPDSRIFVLVPRGVNGQDLELRGIIVGKGPGNEVDSCVAHRISNQ